MRHLVAAVLIGLAGPAFAHPHIFIDTGVEVIFDDQGRAVAVKIAWVYDDFYSLVSIEDRDLDADGDGVLTPEEEAALKGFDMGWDADYNGDLYVLDRGAEVALGRPRDFTASYVAGRITSTHIRDFGTPVQVGTDPLLVQVYDSGYYTAYEITGTALMRNAPEGCTAQVFEPDLTVADKALQDALSEFTADTNLEAQFPAVGAVYADEVQVTCPAG